jgi:hypothetical protein
MGPIAARVLIRGVRPEAVQEVLALVAPPHVEVAEGKIGDAPERDVVLGVGKPTLLRLLKYSCAV